LGATHKKRARNDALALASAAIADQGKRARAVEGSPPTPGIGDLPWRGSAEPRDVGAGSGDGGPWAKAENHGASTIEGTGEKR
jgi:hypothetical protein